MTEESTTTTSTQNPAIESHFLYNPPETGVHCHSASLSETSSGGLLAAWYAYAEEEHRDGCIVVARREPGCSTWSKSKVVVGGEGSSAGNPVIFEAPDHSVRLLFVLLKGGYWNSAELMSTVSNDGGRHWTSPSKVWDRAGMMIRHAPVLLNNGALLLPAYEESDQRSVLLKARPPYMEWTLSYRFEDLPVIQPVLVRRDDGSIACYFRPGSDPRRIWRSHSNDDGASWGTPVRTPLPNPLSGVAAFAVGERTAVVYNHTEKHRRFPLSISTTPDGGISWGEPWHIDNQRFETSYPSFLRARDGRVHGVYTYNRRLIKHVSFDPEGPA